MSPEAKALLEALDRSENESNCQPENDDYDFGEVLKFYSSGVITHHELRFFDELDGNFSYDK
mgnify:CR=1 FL=1